VNSGIVFDAGTYGSNDGAAGAFGGAVVGT
jgi:hypothetical protein